MISTLRDAPLNTNSIIDWDVLFEEDGTKENNNFFSIFLKRILEISSIALGIISYIFFPDFMEVGISAILVAIITFIIAGGTERWKFISIVGAIAGLTGISLLEKNTCFYGATTIVKILLSTCLIGTPMLLFSRKIKEFSK